MIVVPKALRLARKQNATLRDALMPTTKGPAMIVARKALRDRTWRQRMLARENTLGRAKPHLWRLGGVWRSSWIDAEERLWTGQGDTPKAAFRLMAKRILAPTP